MSDSTDSLQLPDWAVDHARAALQLGKSGPETEQLLVARGLSPASAEATVTKLIEDQIGRQTRSEQVTEKRKFYHRALSALVGSVAILLGYWFGGGLSAGRTLVAVLFPVACIWFPDLMESNRDKRLYGATPGAILRSVS